ncbi:547_t:CDS:2 [Diversispora eburnea]|uniref:547_t:CDS:1 n=1 Tax=Diversispora eburnea TaxID=1213867 RepID=A0A9N9B6M9_9GLOM|nr:547_t:CDS:2 [Diversispora eburnea]
MPQEQKQKKKRVPITALTKQQICIKKRENLKLRDEDLAKEYGLDRSTITKILKQKEKWLAIDPNSNYAKQKTQKSPKFPQIEDALAQWVNLALTNGSAVSDSQLQEKALELAQQHGLRNEFQASNGWISKFKNRHHVRSGDNLGVPEISMQQVTSHSTPMTGTSILSPTDHNNFSNPVSLPPTSNYTPSSSISSTPNRPNGTNVLTMGNASNSHYLQYGASTSTSIGPYTPSGLYPQIPNITATPIILDNAGIQTSNTLNQFLTSSRNLFNAVHQAKQKKNVNCFSVGLSFRPGYPELSPHLNSRYLEQFKTTGRLIEGTKGAEFIDGMVPRENDIVIQRRRADAFYNTDLQMILESRSIRHVVLAGIATGDVLLSTILTAFSRDMNITVVRDCCFDINESVQKMLMEEFFVKQNVMVVCLDEILKGLN